MNEFRRVAARIDQQMQQLSGEGSQRGGCHHQSHDGVRAHPAQNLGSTSDPQLMALSSEFPGFYRYALIMEEASEAERSKALRPYDGIAEFSEQHKQMAEQLLTAEATLERYYQAFRAGGNPQAFQPQLNELGMRQRQWLSNLDSFKTSLRAQGAEPKVLEYVNEAFGRMAERIKLLAG